MDMDYTSISVILFVTIIIIIFNKLWLNTLSEQFTEKQIHRPLLVQTKSNPDNHKYSPTYYKDPSVMTEVQQQKFLKKAKFMKMTIQD